MATIIPNPIFDAEDSARKLRNAMKGVGSNEEQIIEVLVSHSANQRSEILRLYKTLFGRDLIEDLKSELSGHFETTVKALLTPKHLYLAKELAKAIKGLGTDEKALIEILCAHMNFDLREIKRYYKEETGKDLESDLAGDTSGDFKHLLISQSNAGRDEEEEIDYEKLDEDSEAVHEASKKKFGANNEVFLSILSTRCYNQLYGTFERYKEKYGEDIEETIKKNTSGYLQEGLLAIVRFTKDPNMFFARSLHSSIKGLGNDNRSLIRIIVFRSEEDLAQISKAYYALYDKSLSDVLNKECTGDYKRLLLAILGNH